MRRKEKEITDFKIIEEILRRATVCRIALNDDVSPHLLPLNFGYSERALYFHSAGEGKKIELIRKNNRVTFEVEDFNRLVSADTACGYTTAFRSVIGTGKIELLTDLDEKIRGLDILMRQHGKKDPNTYREGSVEKLAVLKLTIENISCKQSGEEPESNQISRELIEQAKQYKALAETGMKFQKDPFDQDRYSQVRDLSIKMMALLGGTTPPEVEAFYRPVTDYPTPKVDVRGLVINDSGEVLMVRERVDGRWTIPGGWADIGLTPSEVVVKEIHEEAGLEVTVDRLLAVYDKRCHPHPPSPYYIYKLVFLCTMKEGSLKPGFDILDAGWFSLENLPDLSTDRIVAGQLAELVGNAKSGSMRAVFD